MACLFWVSLPLIIKTCSCYETEYIFWTRSLLTLFLSISLSLFCLFAPFFLSPFPFLSTFSSLCLFLSLNLRLSDNKKADNANHKIWIGNAISICHELSCPLVIRAEKRYEYRWEYYQWIVNSNKCTLANYYFYWTSPPL